MKVSPACCIACIYVLTTRQQHQAYDSTEYHELCCCSDVMEEGGNNSLAPALRPASFLEWLLII